MDFWLGWWLVIMGGAALVTAAVSRRWVWQAALAYLFSPLIIFVAWILWGLVTQPGSGSGLGMALFALAMVGVIGAVPWIAACVLGFAFGLVPRRWLRPPPPPLAAPPADWLALHVGVENDAFAIGGVPVWTQPWRPVGVPPVTLPHPAYAHQAHRFEIYDVGEGAARRRFAAGELSNGVWGFYEPAIPPVPYARVVPSSAPAKRPVAWFSLIAISLAAAVLIAAGSYFTRHFTPAPALTPIPTMPGGKS